MITMGVCAILGAILGLYVKPRWLGVVLVVALVAGVEGGERFFLGLIDDQPNREQMIEQLQAIFGETWLDAAWPVAAALIGGTLAAIMGKAMDRDGGAHVVDAERIHRQVGKDGRYARLDGMIQERPVQTAAESRFDSILGL